MFLQRQKKQKKKKQQLLQVYSVQPYYTTTFWAKLYFSEKRGW